MIEVSLSVGCLRDLALGAECCLLARTCQKCEQAYVLLKLKYIRLGMMKNSKIFA